MRLRIKITHTLRHIVHICIALGVFHSSPSFALDYYSMSVDDQNAFDQTYTKCSMHFSPMRQYLDPENGNTGDIPALSGKAKQQYIVNCMNNYGVPAGIVAVDEHGETTIEPIATGFAKNVDIEPEQIFEDMTPNPAHLTTHLKSETELTKHRDNGNNSKDDKPALPLPNDKDEPRNNYTSSQGDTKKAKPVFLFR